jgi:hypothetical protein
MGQSVDVSTDQTSSASGLMVEAVLGPVSPDCACPRSELLESTETLITAEFSC